MSKQTKAAILERLAFGYSEQAVAAEFGVSIDEVARIARERLRNRVRAEWVKRFREDAPEWQDESPTQAELDWAAGDFGDGA